VSELTEKVGWKVYMMIWTEQMVEDIKNLKTFDAEEELANILKSTEGISKEIIRKCAFKK
jgi:hypothetical protein